MYFNCFYCPIQCFYREYSQPYSTSTSPTPPAGPPPPFIPSKTQVIYQPFSTTTNAYLIIDPSVIETYMFRYVYIWLKNGTGFWGWINSTDGTYITGWMWNGSNWVTFRLAIRDIDLIAAF